MKISNLNIRLNQSWDENPGKYVASVEYEDKSGNIKMPLDPEVTEALMTYLGPLIAKFGSMAAAKIAENITASLQETKQPLIEQ